MSSSDLDLANREKISWLPDFVNRFNTWDRATAHNLAVAYGMAATSMDPDTQVGAFLMCKSGMEAVGVNTLPHRIPYNENKLCRPQKYHYIEHAERNAVMNLLKKGYAGEDVTAYIPWYACVDCARSLLNINVREVIGHYLPFEHTPDRWKESIYTGMNILHDAGVVCSVYCGNLRRHIYTRIDGKDYLVT